MRGAQLSGDSETHGGLVRAEPRSTVHPLPFRAVVGAHPTAQHAYGEVLGQIGALHDAIEGDATIWRSC
jgi:hypothetical protein